ncbi:two-component system sensor histidine kinase KdpD [Silvibacterium bohemicum]|uniref:histidine kinase n=1 Tax=Silvibacterium bohemicum TaxID=1577686 RepID=A0A841K1W9_9BACT|nr:ATP-binding protein [Silvibacterium bohemicum]MBB6145171.1 two-component system sensor histidine kinase KdpD [Silvibacterium bohemicum]
MEKNTASVSRSVIRYVGITLFAASIVLFYRRVIHVNQTTVAFTFLVLILITASRWRLAYSIYLSLLCSLLYNFFFLPPIGTFTINDGQNWIALGAFLCTGILVSQLSDGVRKQAAISESRRVEVERLYTFSQELLLHDDLRTLARTTPSIAARVFGLRAVALYVRDGDATYYSDPGYELLSPAEMKKAASIADPVATEIDGAQVVPLMLGLRSMGSLAVREKEKSSGRLEAVGTLVAIALERAAALDRSSHMEAARESERLRSALLDSVTHDLRTPLTSIRAAASTLVGHPKLPEAERNEMYAVIEEESSRLDTLIGKAIEMAQLDSHSIQVKPRPEDLSELIELALEEARSLLADRTVEVEIPANLPHVNMDRELVRRVLRHLIENAARYSPPASTLRIQARIEDYRLLVSLEDEGKGVDDADRPYIFDKFFRGQNQKAGTSGTGMGLAIVKAIMNAHGGGVEVANRPGRGAIFTFWLPVDVEVLDE